MQGKRLEIFYTVLNELILKHGLHDKKSRQLQTALYTHSVLEIDLSEQNRLYVDCRNK